MSYNSKYKGEEVEGLLESIGNKVDKVDGKQLSTEDFTTLLKQKLDGLSNYDDTEIQETVSKLRTDLDTLVSGDTTTAIKTFNEVIAFLDGISDTEDLSSIIASIEQQIASKGTVTSVTAGEGLAGGIITGSGTISLEKRFANVTDVDLLNKVDILKIGNTVNDTNLTIKDASSVWVKILSFDKFGRYDGGTGYYKFPKEVTFGEATTSLKGLMSASDKAKLDGIDLTGKQDKLVSGTNIKTINGESILGSGDIVISGGSSSDIYVLETSFYESGVVSAEEFEKIRQCKILVLSMYLGMLTIVLQSKVNNEDELSFGTTICYSSAVLYSITFNLNEDGSAGWSLTNTQQYFKTINGESILGESEGDITISGGGSSSGGGGAYAEVSHGTSDTTFTLTPNTFHVWDEVASLDLSFADETAGVANEYLFQFTSGATATMLTLPDVKWANDNAPTIAENMIYQISVLKGLASVLEFNNKIALIDNYGTYSAGTMTSGATLTFEYPVASDLTIGLKNAKNDSVLLAKGQSSVTVDWNEPVAPEFTSVFPLQDDTYIYFI